MCPISLNFLVVVVTIAFEQDDYTYTEGDQVATVCVEILSGTTEKNLAFSVTTSLGNASGAKTKTSK